MMRGLLILLPLTLTLTLALPLLAAACAAQPAATVRPLSASAGNIVAVHSALARSARDKGQWTAMRESAARGAEMFVPERVNALMWLKDRGNPATPLRWQVARVYLSCDGRFAAATGATDDNGQPGLFTTIWARDDSGRWLWLLDHRQPLAAPRPVPDSVESRIASCAGTATAPLFAPAVGDDFKVGLSRDQTLRFASTVRPDGSRRIDVGLWNGTGFDTVILDETGPA